MAIRFGGRFSPGAPRDAEGRVTGDPAPRHRLTGRTRWIGAAAVPLLLGAFFQAPFGMAADLAAFGMLASGMWLTREGLAAEAAYDARRVARRPAIPRKLFGGIATGLGLAVGAYAPDAAAAAGAGVIGVTGALLHWLSFGADPMRDKGMAGVDSFQQDRVARALEESEAYLRDMREAVLRTGDRALEARVQGFAGVARGLFRRIEEDPGDLTAARRYLGVYLMGARDATVKFADLYAATRDPAARAAWEALIAELETTFAARTRSLIEGGRSDMEIEIEVLRDRLAREGVAAPAAPTAPAAVPQIESRRAQVLSDILHETGWKEPR